MHHSLRFYSEHRQGILRFYMFWARRTRVPLLGRLVKWLANRYGSHAHGAYLLTPAEAEDMVAVAECVALGPCTCRAVFKNCDNPVDSEILLGATRHLLLEAMPRGAREISKDEAREILRNGHRRGLINTIIRCRDDFYSICNCCACCCVPLRLSKQYGIGNAIVRHRDILQEFKDYQLAHRD